MAQELLDTVRPDFLLLRVVARALVLWRDVGHDQAWVEGLCPPVVAAYALGRPVRLRPIPVSAPLTALPPVGNRLPRRRPWPRPPTA